MEISRLSKTGQHSGTMSSSIDSTSMNYNLNITRALQKKLEATKRNQHVEYRYTSRDVVTADTATFELIRIASIHYFESTQGNKDVIHIRKYTDKSNSTVVQYTIKIKQPESGYTVNIIYTITNRLLVNGKGWQKLIDKDIPLIHGIISNCNAGIGLD